MASPVEGIRQRGCVTGLSKLCQHVTWGDMGEEG